MDAKQKKNHKNLRKQLVRAVKKHELYAETVKCGRVSSFFVNSVCQ